MRIKTRMKAMEVKGSLIYSRIRCIGGIPELLGLFLRRLIMLIMDPFLGLRL
jgi:hypothetical protein